MIHRTWSSQGKEVSSQTGVVRVKGMLAKGGLMILVNPKELGHGTEGETMTEKQRLASPQRASCEKFQLLNIAGSEAIP